MGPVHTFNLLFPPALRGFERTNVSATIGSVANIPLLNVEDSNDWHLASKEPGTATAPASARQRRFSDYARKRAALKKAREAAQSRSLKGVEVWTGKTYETR